MLRTLSFKKIGVYLYELARSIDQFGNALGLYLFNDLFIVEGGHKFGDIDETISSVLGRNQLTNTLSKKGSTFRKLIDWIFGEGHCINSIGTRIKQ